MGKGIGSSNTVLTLLAGKKAWTPLASLPRSLYGSRASLVEEKMRVVGGQQGEEGAEGDYRNEVKISLISCSILKVAAEAIFKWSVVPALRSASDQVQSDSQVLEYEAGPPARWVEVGKLRTKRADHALITVGPEDLPCLR